MKYKNIHTNEVKEVSKVKTIKSYPNDIIVTEFEDGTRWNQEELDEHWIPMPETLIKD